MGQGMKFIVAGLSGASIDFGVSGFLVEVFGVHPSVAYIPSGLAAVTFVFIFNKFVTFRSHGHAADQTLRFIVVYSIAFALNYLVALGLFWLGIHYMLAKAIAIGLIAFLNYVLSHGFIFRKSEAVDMPL